jgi:hypothetical protein
MSSRTSRTLLLARPRRRPHRLRRRGRRTDTAAEATRARAR